MNDLRQYDSVLEEVVRDRFQRVRSEQEPPGTFPEES